MRIVVVFLLYERMKLFVYQVDALMRNLLKLRSEDPTIKSLVVSQFTKFLNLLEVPLR